MENLDLSTPYSEVMWKNWLSQFEHKPHLKAYMQGLVAPLDLMQQVLNDLLNKRGVDTAQGAQVDGVGVIVGQARYVPGAFLIPFFGFEGQRATTGFDQARMRRMGESNEDAQNKMGDADYRQLIKWKIVVNASNGTIPDIHKAMRALFNDVVKVKVSEPGTRQLNVEVITKGVPNPIFANNLEMFIPKLAGIKVTATAKRQGT